MRKVIFAVGASLIALYGIAKADDHLFEARQHGLSDGPGVEHGSLAPGQGSPFSGHDTQTPATDTDAANAHANVKDR